MKTERQITNQAFEFAGELIARFRVSVQNGTLNNPSEEQIEEYFQALESKLNGLKALRIIDHVQSLGWKDVHGGAEENGMYWRGVHPMSGRVEEVPKYLTEFK